MENVLTLFDLLSHIDLYQYLEIKSGGDILFNGRRMYLTPSAPHKDIQVVNILVKPDDTQCLTISVNQKF